MIHTLSDINREGEFNPLSANLLNIPEASKARLLARLSSYEYTRDRWLVLPPAKTKLKVKFVVCEILLVRKKAPFSTLQFQLHSEAWRIKKEEANN